MKQGGCRSGLPVNCLSILLNLKGTTLVTQATLQTPTEGKALHPKDSEKAESLNLQWAAGCMDLPTTGTNKIPPKGPSSGGDHPVRLSIFWRLALGSLAIIL